MQAIKRLPFFTLVLLITLGSVNAIFFTPSLPMLSAFFNISTTLAQSSMSWYLAGYALGQLVYSPFANRYGRKPALYMGLTLGLIASLICISSAHTHSFNQFLLGRFLLALGTGVGFKMAFILVHDVYDQHEGHKLISYLISAFAVLPGLALAFAGYLAGHYGWISCQWFSLVYVIITAVFVAFLPETKLQKDLQALRFKKLTSGYTQEMSRFNLWQGGLMMGLVTSILYLFSVMGPFIGIQLLGLSETGYGTLCFLPQAGMFIGSIVAAQLVKKHLSHYSLPLGIMISIAFAVVMAVGLKLHISPVFMLFGSISVIYLGTSLIFTAAPALAFKGARDHAYASGLLNFINLGSAMILISVISLLPLSLYTLPIALCSFSIVAGIIFLSIR